MAFRDEYDAALERIRALEREKAELQAELESARGQAQKAASKREQALAAEARRLRAELEAAKKGRSKPAPAPPPRHPARAARWHQVCRVLTYLTGSALLFNATSGVVSMTTEEDAAIVAAFASAAVGYLLGFAGLVAGGIAIRHHAGIGWGTALGALLFWPLFMFWPVVSLFLMIIPIRTLWRGKVEMGGDANIGALGKTLAMTMLLMALEVQVISVTLFVIE